MKAKKCIEELEPYGYVPGEEAIAEKYGLEVKDVKHFDRNTSPSILRAVGRELEAIAKDGIGNEYPDSRYPELTRLLAGYVGVGPGQIVLGNGADEAIDLLARAYVSDGDTVVISTPTFSFYGVAASMNGGRPVEVARNSDFSLDTRKLLEAAAKEDARILFVCNPNNPTADFTPIGKIRELAEGFGGIVAVDEAYIEFSGGESAAGLIAECPNIVVIRTLSKAFGLAGMRVGYLACSAEIAGQLNKLRQPYNINPVSERLAIAALSNIREVEENVRMLVAERERVASALWEMGFEVLPSSTNFLLVKCRGKEPQRIYDKLIRKGMVIRKFGGELSGMLRISMRGPEDNNLLLGEFRKIYDGVIFDIDGVLVDVSRSYREAIRQTVRATCGKEITMEDIEDIKKVPGSNNDWDVTYALAKGLREFGGIDREGGEYAGIKEKFQELYLGGLRDKEELLIERGTLDSLKEGGYRLGIVTSRPREEALYALRELVPRYFPQESIIALEDCDAQKPDGKPLLLAKERMGCRNPVYVGDTINDAIAAKNAKMAFVSVVPGLEGDYSAGNANMILKVI